jgi:methionyl-tRNA formyltransferase
MSSLRIIFMGTPELACASLQALIDADATQVVAVVTQPDRPKARDLKLLPSPVKELALKAGLAVLQPERARNEAFIQQLRELRPDLIAVAAYGQILPEDILNLPPHGCLNVHTSLLPKYRGAAPIQWSILNDDAETGVTIMKMDAGLDTGDILTQEMTVIQPEDNSGTLHDRLAKIGAALLVKTIPDYVSGKIAPQPQNNAEASYAPKIKKQDGRIDWTKSARFIWNRVRGFTPWPGTFTELRGESPARILKIWQASVSDGSGTPGEILRADKTGILVACGEGALQIHTLQREGGKRLAAQDFLAGCPLRPGQAFA